MAKEMQATEAKSNRNSPAVVEPATAGELGYELAGLSKLPAGLSGGGNGSIHAQAALLSNPRLQAAQRQALAAQVGRTQGNGHLERIVALRRLMGPEGHDLAPHPRLAVTPMHDTMRISRNPPEDEEETAETTTAPRPTASESWFDREYQIAEIERGRFKIKGSYEFEPRGSEEQGGEVAGALELEAEFMSNPTITRDLQRCGFQISQAVMEAEAEISLYHGLSVNVEFDLLEAELQRASGEGVEADLSVVKLSMGIVGTVQASNADALLSQPMAAQLRQSRYNLEVSLAVEVGLAPQELARLARYHGALRRVRQEASRLEHAVRQIESDRARLQRLRETGQILRRSRESNWTLRTRNLERRLRLRAEIAEQRRRADELRRALQAADDEVRRAARYVPRSLSRMKTRLAETVLGRLAQGAWAHLIPYVGTALFILELFEVAPAVWALASGRAAFGTEQGAERAAEHPAESLEEARPGAGEEGRGGDIEERVHVPGAEEDIGGGGTSTERIEGAEETEEGEEEAPAAEAEGGPGGVGPTEEAPEEAEEAIPAGVEVSEVEFEEQEVVEARPAEARGEGFRNFLERADPQMAAYRCAVRFVPLEDIHRVEVGHQIQGMAAVRIEGGQVIGGYPVTGTIDRLQQVDGGSRITAISLSPFDGFDAEGNFVAEVPSIHVAIEMAAERAPHEEEEQLEGTTTDLPQDVAREEGAAGR